MEEEEQRILDTYQPAPLQDSDSDVDVCPIRLHLKALKTYVSSVLNTPISFHRDEKLEVVLYQEKRDI